MELQHKDIPYFPMISRRMFFLSGTKHTEYSTYVRILRDGTWYCVYHKRTMTEFKNSPSPDVEAVDTFQRLIFSAYSTMLFYKITGRLEEIDPLQISEEERMDKYYEPIQTRPKTGSETQERIQRDKQDLSQEG